MYFSKTDSPTLNKIKDSFKEVSKKEEMQELWDEFHQLRERLQTSLEVLSEEIDQLKDCKKKK